jgi:hypothetical protein
MSYYLWRPSIRHWLFTQFDSHLILYHFGIKSRSTGSNSANEALAMVMDHTQMWDDDSGEALLSLHRRLLRGKHPLIAAAAQASYDIVHPPRKSVQHTPKMVRGRASRADMDYAALTCVVQLAKTFDGWNGYFRLPPKQLKQMVCEQGQVHAYCNIHM